MGIGYKPRRYGTTDFLVSELALVLGGAQPTATMMKVERRTIHAWSDPIGDTSIPFGEMRRLAAFARGIDPTWALAPAETLAWEAGGHVTPIEPSHERVATLLARSAKEHGLVMAGFIDAIARHGERRLGHEERELLARNLDEEIRALVALRAKIGDDHE